MAVPELDHGAPVVENGWSAPQHRPPTPDLRDLRGECTTQTAGRVDPKVWAVPLESTAPPALDGAPQGRSASSLDRGLALSVFPHFYGDDSASGDPGIAIDPDPISEVLVVPVEEALDLLDSGFFRFDLTAVPIAC